MGFLSLLGMPSYIGATERRMDARYDGGTGVSRRHWVRFYDRNKVYHRFTPIDGLWQDVRDTSRRNEL